MPNPREIAKQKNESSKFAGETGYDPIAGTPSGVSSAGREPDYAANPKNPPEGPNPSTSMKG